MSDPKIERLYKRTTLSFQKYQRESFWQLNEAPDKLEEEARNWLSSPGRSLLDSLSNRQSFIRQPIISDHLADINHRDIATTLFGHKCSGPIGFAPIGVNKIYHAKGELPVAKVTGELRLPYGLSTAGSTAIEDVAVSNDEGAKLASAVKAEGADNEPIQFFQLCMPHGNELTASLLIRAHESGFTAYILTTDTWQLGWRHDDIKASNYAFYRGIDTDMGLTDPVFKKRLAAAGIDPKKHPEEAGAMWIDSVWHGHA